MCAHVEHTCVHLERKHMQLKHTCVYTWDKHMCTIGTQMCVQEHRLRDSSTHVCTRGTHICARVSKHKRSPKAHTHASTSKTIMCLLEHIHAHTWRANISSDAKSVHLEHTNVFTRNTHVFTWTTNTCSIETDMCVVAAHTYVYTCTHICAHVNTHIYVPGTHTRALIS